jgi:XisH protein
MPKLDKYHPNVRAALEKAGWLITHDPYFIRLGKRRGYIDLAAEIIGAERGTEKIAVEIKSFSGLSDVNDFEDALGQFMLYKLALLQKEPDRTLYLAMPRDFYSNLFDDPFFVQVLKTYQVLLVIYNFKTNEIEEWIK